MFFRIGIINDFSQSFSFVEYRKFGITQSWAGFKTSSVIKTYQKPDDGIHIFINYEKVAFFKDKKSAVNKIEEILKLAPTNLEEFKEYLTV